MSFIPMMNVSHSVDRSIRLKLISTLGKRKKGTGFDKKLLFQGIYDVLRHYNKADIFISKISEDNKFRSIMKDINNKWEIKMNFALRAENLPYIERANSLLKE